MKNTFFGMIIIVCLFCNIRFVKADNRPLLFVLSGQSNMLTYGAMIDQIGSGNDVIPENVDFYAMVPGEESYGFQKKTNFVSTQYTEYLPAQSTFFGPEVGLSKQIAALYPDRKIVIVKYAMGGTDSCQWRIKNWDVITNRECIANGTSSTIQDVGGTILSGNYGLGNNLMNSLATQFPSQNYEYKSLIWFQGENDSEVGLAAGVYNYTLQTKEFFEAIKSRFSAPNMSMIMTLISREWPIGHQEVPALRSIQVAFGQDNANVYTVDTKDLPRPDIWHIDAPSVLLLGKCYYKSLRDSIDVSCPSDLVAPVINQVTAVQSPTADNTPDYTFYSSEAGVIAYLGGCSSATTNAIAGNNDITFNTLTNGEYANCKIVVTNSLNNPSNVLMINDFIVNVPTPIVTPVVETDAVESITSFSAVGNGNITNNGGDNPARYITWGTVNGGPYPNSCSAGFGSTGLYACNLTSLSPGTTYYVQAMAINTAGISYGSQTGFTTAVATPTVVTQSVSVITTSSATGNGNISNTGGENPTRYIEWGTVSGSYSNSCNAGAGGLGVYSCNIINLSPDTTYYVRSKAVNSAGSSYGSEIIFTTLAVVQAKTVSPVASPDEGTFNLSQTVTLTSETQGSAIHYTIDGSSPTVSSRVYDQPITISQTTTLKAFATKASMIDSDIEVYSYIINRPGQVVLPQASSPGGSYVGAQLIALSTTTPDAMIYYTIDGSVPTSASNKYVSSFSISQSVTLKAIATKENMANSQMMVENYIISNGSQNSENKVKKVAKPKRDIKNSKKQLNVGETLYQSGRGFSKNNVAILYFGKYGGGYYPPETVNTNKKGAFVVTYVIPPKKPKGTYYWYAVDSKTGKKSKVIYFKVK